MINHLKQVFILIFATLLTSVADATPVEELTQLLNNLHTMRASFVQTVYDNRGKAVQTAQGEMQFQRPGKFRWETNRPFPQLIIANGSRLWIYDPDLAQVTIRSLSKEIGEAPALLLSHVTINQYRIQKMPTKDALAWYRLVPKNRDSLFAAIQLGFAANQLKEMRLQDQLGHTTRVQFTRIVTNPALSSSSFTFKLPANVDVIDETRRP